MTKVLNEEQLKELVEKAKKVLQSPDNDKNLDKILKGFIEGIKTALGEVTGTGYAVGAWSKGLDKMKEDLIKRMAEENKEAAITEEK